MCALTCDERAAGSSLKPKPNEIHWRAYPWKESSLAQKRKTVPMWSKGKRRDASTEKSLNGLSLPENCEVTSVPDGRTILGVVGGVRRPTADKEDQSE
jgi:hypothetical protein